MYIFLYHFAVSFCCIILGLRCYMRGMGKTATKLPQYVWARPNSRLLWFRMAVPKSVREYAGKSIVQYPLGTADPR